MKESNTKTQYSFIVLSILTGILICYYVITRAFKLKNQLSFLLIISVFTFTIQGCKQKKTENKKEEIVYSEEQKITYKSGNPEDFTEALDAVISAPKNHKILLENDKVRVLEVTLRPKELEPLHHHRWPSVLYIMEAGDFIDRDKEGNVILDTRQLAERLVFPMTMYKNPEAPHSVENLSDTKTIRLIRVEMKE